MSAKPCVDTAPLDEILARYPAAEPALIQVLQDVHRAYNYLPCDVIARAERMRRELFRPGPRVARLPVWEPPVDVLETDHEVMVIVALPGVDPENVEAAIDGAELTIVGARVLPGELRTAVIHRLELPQGRFERRLRLPAGRYGSVQRRAAHGCIVITLKKSG